ncbi:MAG TPA: hypothetical protein VGG35_01740 [Streptosporangiaceae bacterium]|jgi:hypothetical protein
MVPDEYIAYFTAAAAAAGVLIGLLFVAVTLRPESVSGDRGAPLAQATAGSAFTALVNSFFVAIIALIPGTSLGYTAAVMAVVSMYNTIRLHAGIGRRHAPWILLVVSVVAYLIQLSTGIALIVAPHEVHLVHNIAYVLIASFGVALSRAWTLLRGQRLARPA